MSDATTKKRPFISHDLVVGAFVFAVFVGLVLFTIVLSGMSMIGKKGTKLFVEFERVGGLRRHDSVIVRGMPVGQVKDLELRENGVLVSISLVEPVTIREGYAVRAESTSLLGGMQLVIDTGKGAPVSHSAKEPLKGLPPENVMDSANALIGDLRQSLNEGGIRTNLEQIIEDVRVVTGNLREGEGTLGHLLSTNDAFYVDLAMTVSNLNAISTRIERGEGMVGRLLSSDETAYNQLTNFIANLDAIGARLERGDGAIGRLLSADDPMATDLADTIHNLKVISERLERGEGLLGQLMRDDGEVGQQVNGLLKDGRDLIDDYRETSPVSTFSSIFFGAL